MTNYNVLTAFEIDGIDYIAVLCEQRGNDIDAELLICKYRAINGEEIELIEILDDEEFDRAAAFFESLSIEQ